MDKSSVAGATDELNGAAKDAIGKTVSDTGLHSNGDVDKTVSRIRSYAGSLNAAVRDAAGLLIASPIKRGIGA
jgi:uncharacterized protein YjbJ (UPF0337 family)